MSSQQGPERRYGLHWKWEVFDQPGVSYCRVKLIWVHYLQKGTCFLHNPGSKLLRTALEHHYRSKSSNMRPHRQFKAILHVVLCVYLHFNGVIICPVIITISCVRIVVKLRQLHLVTQTKQTKNKSNKQQQKQQHPFRHHSPVDASCMFLLVHNRSHPIIQSPITTSSHNMTPNFSNARQDTHSVGQWRRKT